MKNFTIKVTEHREGLVVVEGKDENGLCFSCWGVTDNYDSDRPFVCKQTDTGKEIVLDAA